MSNKLKSLICALMAGAMMVTSVGLTAFAEDTTETVTNENGAAVEATATPETEGENAEETNASEETPAEAEAEAPTEAPTEAAKGYDSDTYYQNALKVVSALGIITGYDDGSIKPESTVTRAEMAAIVLRMLAQDGNSTYQNVFTDLTSDHWAANTIQTAVEQGILDGMGDGTFVPDGNVTYEQVIKMIVCAMNYGVDAENQGGYPNGYVAVGGTTLKLLTSVAGSVGQDMPRGEVIKAVYNALLASYREITDFKNGLPVYSSKDTLGVSLFDMYEEEGVLTTTPNLTIANGTASKAGVITIDGVDYKCDLNVDEYVGTKIKFYYIDDKSDDPKVIALFSMGKSTEYKIDADDIDGIDLANGSMKVYKSKSSSSTTNYKINNATVVYNGTILSTADYKASDRYDEKVSFDEFITPEVGTVRIVDYDNDGVYDVLFVESYETMLVTNATTEKLTGKIKNVNTTITYDLDDNDYTVTVTKSGSNATVKNLRKNDVASIKRDIASETIDITVTGESITGSITSIGEDDGDTTVTVNGQTYKVDENALSDIKTGLSGQFYLDMFDRIGYINTDGALTGSESYAMITKAFYNDENELVIRLYTQEGAEIEVKPASSLNYWAPGASAAVSKPSETTLYNTLNSENAYIQCNGNPVKLCKYSLNSSGDLTKLYVAVSTAKAADSSDALYMYSSNMNGVASVGGTLSGYTINDGIVEFSAPNDTNSSGELTGTDRFSGSNYSTGTVTASSYKSYDGGVSIDFVIGGFTSATSKTADVLVKFTTSATSLYGISEFDTASIMPAIIVSKINEAVDDDGDTIFEIKGYTGGTEVSYMTMDTTGVYEFTGWNDREYGGDLLFDATSNDASKMYSVLEPGDIIALATSGSNIKAIAKMVDAGDVASMAVKYEDAGSLSLPYSASAVGSASREYYYMGFVSSLDIDDSAYIGLSDINKSSETAVTYDTNTVFSLVTLTVNSSGKITNTKVDKSGGIEPAELTALGDDPDEYYYGMFTSLKGNMNNGYIIKVVIDR